MHHRDDIEILYEISLKVGTSLELEPMLRDAVSTMLRLLNCSGVQILQAMVDDAAMLVRWQPVIAMPRPISRNRAHLDFLAGVELPTGLAEWPNWAKRLPIQIQDGHKARLLFDLPGFGVLALEKNGEPFGFAFVRSLQELLHKLANASLACLDVIERRRIEEELRRRRLYEHLLLSDITTRAVNVVDVESFQEECLALLGSGLSVSRAYLIEYRQAADDVFTTHQWHAPGIAPRHDPPGGSSGRTLHWLIDTLQAKHAVNLTDIADIPDAETRQAFGEQQTRSMLAVPLYAQGRFVGWIGLDDCVSPRRWLEEDLAILHSICRIIDSVGERIRTEKALRASEERIRSILRSAPIGIGMVIDRVLKQVNRRLCGMVGYEKEELLERSARILYPSDQEYEFVGREKYIQIRDHGTGTVETKWQRRDGQIIDVLLSSTPIDLNDLSKGVTFTALDITERKRVEAEREQLQAQLTQAQKMESIGRLAGGVAHDFNNMLSVILGRTELAQRFVDMNQPLGIHLAAIRKAADHSADITRQLLAFARKQPVAPKVLDLNGTVESMLGMIRRLIGENIDLAWLPGSHVRPVRIDPSQIDQILVNLCVNARDAIADTGRITIETGSVVFDEAYCSTHPGFVPGDYVQLSVSDDGSGMDKETLDHVFEPFYTTKELGKGTGLGLAMIYGIVKQNGGFINVYSEAGQGSRFTIYLPPHRGAMEGGAGLPGPEEPVKGSLETVLLVEDDPAILEMATLMLQDLGYTVLPAGSPGEAIRLAETHPDRISLLVTDVVMPGMNGRDLSAHLRTLLPHLRCLYMSGYTANVIAQHGVLDEGVHFLQKPFSMHQLGTMVHRLLEINGRH